MFAPRKLPLTLVSLAVCLAVLLCASATGAQEKKIPGIPVVKTWKDLQALPAIDVGGGVKIRVGLEANKVPRWSGALVYCLTEGWTPATSGEGPEPLGPVHVVFDRGKEPGAVKELRWEAKWIGPEKEWAKGSYLFVRTLSIDEVGPFHLHVTDAKGKVLAQTILEGTKDVFHPWAAWSFERQLERVPALAFRGIALPVMSAYSPRAFIAPGKTKEGKLPTLWPRDEKPTMSVRLEGSDLIVRCETEFIFTQPHRHFLARWWVNGEPWVPEQPDRFWETNESGFVLSEKETTLPLLLLPAQLGARPGDKIGLQIMYCENGWEVCRRGHHEARAAERKSEEEEKRAVRISNRIEFVPRMSRIGKLVNESLAKSAVGSLLDNDPLRRADLTEALDFIKANDDYASYHLLLALRKFYPDSYREISRKDRAAILCSSLRKLTHLDDFGSLSPEEGRDGDAAQALLETSKEAVTLLKPLLDDDGRVQMKQAENVVLNNRYKYRRQDFAYRYLSLVLERTPTFAAEPVERDKAIDALKKSLGNLGQDP